MEFGFSIRDEDSIEVSPEPLRVGGLTPVGDVPIWTGEVETRFIRAEAVMKGTVGVQDDSAIPRQRAGIGRRAYHDLGLDPRAGSVADLPREGAETRMNFLVGAVPLEEQQVVARASQAIE